MNLHVPISFERSACLPSGDLDTDLHFHHLGTFVVFNLDGPLALQWIADGLCREVQRMLEGGRSNLILDLTDASYIDSAGIGALLVTRKLIYEAGGRLLLVSANRRVMDMLKRMRLESLFTFCDDKPLTSLAARLQSSKLRR